MPVRFPRAWWLTAVWLCLSLATPTWAATRVTIGDLKEHPERYVDQMVSLECYYDKESPIWVRALPDADEWVGFFVTGPPEEAMTWQGEYYNLLFAPQEMQDALRMLRGGDKVTIVGKGFQYRATNFSGVGIHVQQLLKGWGASAKAIGEAPSGSGAVTASRHSDRDDREHAMRVTTEVEAATSGKYTAIINGKRYEGLRVGDRYNFEGIDFQVEKAQ